MKKFIVTQAAAALMLLIIATTGCKKNVNPNDPNNGNESNDNLEYVDLGLPSGTLWANCNIGATVPEGYGNYYSWAEIEKKELYKWDTYKYCNESGNQLTKYCNDPEFGNEGFSDNLTILESGDDAAIALLGNEWCMPTKEQMAELINNCTWKWTGHNGVNGFEVTGSNGNSIFLPAGGMRHDNGNTVSVEHGYYWLNSFDTGNPTNAWNFMIGADLDVIGNSTATAERYIGFSVRPVHPYGWPFCPTN